MVYKCPEGPLTFWWVFRFPNPCQNSRDENSGEKRNTTGWLLQAGFKDTGWLLPVTAEGGGRPLPSSEDRLCWRGRETMDFLPPTLYLRWLCSGEWRSRQPWLLIRDPEAHSFVLLHFLLGNSSVFWSQGSSFLFAFVLFCFLRCSFLKPGLLFFN